MARPLYQAQHGGAGRVCKHSNLLNRESTTQPNAGPEPLGMAEARDERTLFAVACTLWFGDSTAVAHDGL